jgi:hypothetical protein
MKKAYLSVIFANRNDNYGNDQATRLNTFIEYYSAIVKRSPDLFEFIICDWNPPSERPALLDAYDWKLLGKVKSFSVHSDIHQGYAKDCKRPMLDYIARNACIRRANSDWVLVLNQDIFLSEQLIQYLAKKQLNPRYFYRADRVDFDFEKVKTEPVNRLLELAKQNMLKRHIRPWPEASSNDMSPSVQDISLENVCSGIFDHDQYDKENQIIYCDGYLKLRQKLQKKNTLKRLFFKNANHNFYLKFGLHTNFG